MTNYRKDQSVRPFQWNIDLSAAPMGVKVLVWRQGGCFPAYRDEVGNWRAMHHGPHKTEPLAWALAPDGPDV